MAELKDKVTTASVRLQRTIDSNAGISAIKAARTRWENANRLYWAAVHEAAAELDNDRRKKPASVCEAYGIDPLDLMEVTR